MQATGNTIEIHGRCNHCQAPIFLNHCTDWYGNSIVSLNCWNGHYKWLDFENIQEDLHIDPETQLVTYIGFFDAP